MRERTKKKIAEVRPDLVPLIRAAVLEARKQDADAPTRPHGWTPMFRFVRLLRAKLDPAVDFADGNITQRTDRRAFFCALRPMVRRLETFSW